MYFDSLIRKVKQNFPQISRIIWSINSNYYKPAPPRYMIREYISNRQTFVSMLVRANYRKLDCRSLIDRICVEFHACLC